MTKTAILAAVLLATPALAQTSKTLPKGQDTTASNSNFWSGWDILNGSTVYHPARTLYLFNQAAFPWGATANVMRGFKVRRDEALPSGSSQAHVKEVRVYISYNGNNAQRPDTGSFEGNHGVRKTLVVGSTSAPAKINFPGEAAQNPAPFTTDFKFNAPYPIAANAASLSIEFRAYKTSIASGRWRPDTHSYGDSANSGSQTILAGGSCLTPPMDVAPNLGSFIGSSFTARYNTNRSSIPVVGLLGVKLANSIPIPRGSKTCQLWTIPILTIAKVTGSVAAGTVDMNWGPVPEDQNLVGAVVTHQLAFVDAQGLGFSQARTKSIGSGYQSTTLGSIVYSYGNRTSNWNGKLVDPDNEADPRHFTSRAGVFEVY